MTRIKEDLGLPITSLNLHVTDTTTGTPAVGVHLALTAPDGHVLRGRTDASGRARVDDGLLAGTHRLALEVGAWFGAQERACGYGDVIVVVEITNGLSHDIALTLAPYAYAVTLEPHPYEAPSGTD